jgi:hypothetical protein
MDQLRHDSAASMEVRFLLTSNGRGGQREITRAGWYVVRTCTCHNGHAITEPFDNRERAAQALAVLDDDARRYAIRS